ncbi:aldehyde dehydrogenase [Candidatus Peregrinibacteria bacterium]|nr:aldehyde dehydrogenase [Candidatus Peregrinibacteria bacterium]
MSVLRVALNGYGRIGRNLHRILIGNTKVQLVAINNQRLEAPMRAHLLKYDSLHGKLDAEISYTENSLIVNGETILLLAFSDAREVPWKELDIDVVVSATGRARTKEEAQKFLDAGAKKVLVSAPMKDDTPTFVFGVNDEDITADLTIMSNASCTTNSIAPPLKLIEETYGIENVFVSSIHSFTNSQNLLDNMGKDLRRARSAVQNIIPTTSGAMQATAKVIPSLQGRIDGIAFRIPLATSSISDVCAVLKKDTTAEEVNNLFRKAAAGKMKNVLEVCEEPLVSIDFKTNPHSAIIDALTTKVVGGKYLQFLSWYDNEWGYANRLKDFLEKLATFKKWRKSMKNVEWKMEK